LGGAELVTPLVPYAYQQEDINRLVANDGTGIVATQVGGGKTLIAVEVAKSLNTQVNLVIAPKGTHKTAWQKTIMSQIPEATIHAVNSSRDGTKAWADLHNNVAGWYLISPEYFRKFHWGKCEPDLAVFDEVHRASNRKSVTAVMLHTLKAKRRIGMSGTIAGNRIEGFWSIIKWIEPDIAGKSFWRWVDKYCTTKFDPFAGKTVDSERSPGLITSSLSCYIRHLKREKCCDRHPQGMDADLPAVVEEARMVQLSAEQKRIYKKMEKDLIVWLDQNPLVADVPIATRIRLRQITLGIPQVSEDGEVSFATDCKSTKIDEMFEIIGDLPKGEPLLILTHSQKFARVVTDRLIFKGIEAFEWSGKKSQPERDEALQEFRDRKLQAIVGVISAIGEGTDGLQDVCSTVIWLSRDDNRLMNEQAAGRLDRRGQSSAVLSFDILAEGTYDEGQLSKLVEDRLRMNASLREGKSE
jgi:superfamily II DNA or RNA helicase